MRWVLCSVLGLGSGTNVAGPPEPSPHAQQDPAIEPDYDPAILARAESLWAAGKFTEARRLLEPLAENGPMDDRLFREKVLTVLADASMNDPELPEDERREQATQHLDRLMDRDRSWRMPPNLFSFELFNLYLDLRMERAERAGETCSANLVACQSSVDNAASEIRRRDEAYSKLRERYAEQEVEVRERVARSRIFAALPFGIGQFYNGDRALGATFLATEVALGLTGLALLINRTWQDRCSRTRGFQEGSLVCDPRNPGTTHEDLKNRRRAEETMAWLFLGTIVVDVVVAQIRFRPYELTAVRRVKRRDLDNKGTVAPSATPPTRKLRSKPRGKVQASPSFGPHGAGFNVEIHF